MVVGVDGRVYAMDESGTFRLENQCNLLVKDNQTPAFQNMNAAGRRAFTTMTWGDDRGSLPLAGPGTGGMQRNP